MELGPQQMSLEKRRELRILSVEKGAGKEEKIFELTAQ
jgi:hypothetical protein